MVLVDRHSDDNRDSTQGKVCELVDEASARTA